MKVPCLCIIIFFLLLLPAAGVCDVTVYDDVIPVGKEVMLRAVTKGRFFPRGGQIVEFYVDGRSIGRSLSGGDGQAFRAFVPEREGTTTVTVRSGEHEAEGFVVAVGKEQELVFYAVESEDPPGFLYGEALEKRRLDAERIVKKYPVVYLQTGILGTSILRSWLWKNGFPKTAVMSWKEGAVFSLMAERGIRIRAVVGSPRIIESARRYYPEVEGIGDADGAEKPW